MAHSTTPGTVLPHGGHEPRIDSSAFVAPTATVVGDAELGPESGVFYGAVVRGDRSPVRLGARSNLQDNVVVHSDPGHPCTIGADVSVGHGAVVHGCTVEDEVLIGMNATVLNGAVIGTGSLVAVRFSDHDLTRPLAIIHRRSAQLGLTASRFLKLLTEAVAARAEGRERRAEPKPA